MCVRASACAQMHGGRGRSEGAQLSRSGGQHRKACRGQIEQRGPCERGKVLEIGTITKQKNLPNDRSSGKTIP